MPTSQETSFRVISSPLAFASCCFSQSMPPSGWVPVLVRVPPPVRFHLPATGLEEPFRLSSPFMNRILLFLARRISAAFCTGVA